MNIALFGFNDWYEWEATGFRTRCGQLAQRLTKRDDVGRLLVVSTGRSAAVNAARGLRARLGAADPRYAPTPYRARRVAPGVEVLDRTVMLPRDGADPLAYRVNGWFGDEALREAVRDTFRDDPDGFIAWVADPLMAKHIGCLGERLSVFDAIDDWTRHPQKARMRREVEAGYRLARERADVVFTVSAALAERLGDGREGVFVQPNGVEYERFSASVEPPVEIAHLPRPLLGYVGIIQERLDVGLVTALSVEMPDASIVLVGPIASPEHVKPLARLRNVHLIGQRPFAEMPAYVSAFDVALIPHVDDDFTRSMDPLKLYEYLAAGKPVVARGVAAPPAEPGLVVCADDASSFVAAARSAAMRDDGLAGQRRAFAATRSWDARLDEMLALVHDADAARQQAPAQTPAVATDAAASSGAYVFDPTRGWSV